MEPSSETDGTVLDQLAAVALPPVVSPPLVSPVGSTS